MKTAFATLALLTVATGTAHATCSIHDQIEWDGWSLTQKITLVQAYTLDIRLQCDALPKGANKRLCYVGANRMYAEASRKTFAGEAVCMPDIAHKYFE